MKRILFKLIIPVAIVLGLLGFSDVSISKGFINDVTSIASSLFEQDTTNKELEKNEVTVAHVVDGDTISVILSNGEKESVRLLLIDTPESVHPNKPVQPFGKEASNFAKETLQEGQTVTLEKGNPERDKYGRLLGYIWIDDTNFNQLMIEKGYARVAYVYEPNTKYLDEFKKAEHKAKERKLNIWSIPGYVKSEFLEH